MICNGVLDWFWVSMPHRGLPLAVFALPLVLAQAPPAQEPVFRVTSALVQIDAVVTDSKGHYIVDLKAGDFQVFEDGKPQPITAFSYVPLSAPPPVDVASRLTTTAHPSELLPNEVKRTIVLLVDDLGLSFESMAFVRRALHKFVDQQMEPGDLVAIGRSGSTSSAFEQFSSDKRFLSLAIDRLKWNAFGRASIGVFQPLGWSGPPVLSHHGNVSGPVEWEHESALTNFTVGTLGAMNNVIAAMHGLPGRKSLVLMSDGFSLGASDPNPADRRSRTVEGNWEVLEPMRKLVDRANRAGTVIYTIDCRLLQPLALQAADRPALDGLFPSEALDELHAAESDRRASFHASQQGLDYLAGQTGGFLVANDNDLNWGLGKVLKDQQGYYLIDYKPDSKTFEDINGRRDFHRIQVKLNRKGLRVRSRTGFFGATDEEMKPRYATPLEELQASMLSPFHADGVRLRLTPVFLGIGKDRTVRNLLYIDSSDLTFNPDGAQRKAVIDLLAIAVGAGDQPLIKVNRVLEAKVTPEQMEGTRRDGLLYILETAVPKPGAYQIRAAVRDESSSRIGSASSYIVVPDTKKHRLTLSTVTLVNGESGEEKFLGMTPALRRFRRGDEIEFFCIVGESARRVPGGNLDSQVRLFQDGKQIYSGSANLAHIEGSDQVAITGRFRVNGSMESGHYDLQVLAMNTSGGSRNKSIATAQWTDFEVIP